MNFDIRVYTRVMDPPIIINIFEWRRLWYNEEDDEDAELGLENWETKTRRSNA
jgi:hypothetical protein